MLFVEFRKKCKEKTSNRPLAYNFYYTCAQRTDGCTARAHIEVLSRIVHVSPLHPHTCTLQ